MMFICSLYSYGCALTFHVGISDGEFPRDGVEIVLVVSVVGT